MSWTSPATYSVNEIVTAAKLNLHIRDNIKYLKGQAGSIAFEAGATFQGDVVVNAEDSGIYVDTGANRRIGLMKQTGFATELRYLDSIALSVRRVTSGTLISPSASDVPLTFSTGGDLGINRATPQGKLHGYDTISGFLHWEYDGVDGTARTVIPNGAGDVLYRLVALFVVRDDTGATSAGLASGPTASQTLHTNAADQFDLRVNADGSVDVRRAAGTTRTAKITLWCLWI